MFLDRATKTSPIATGLLRTNHQIYHEALLCLYRTPNTVVVTTRKRRSKVLFKLVQGPRGLERCREQACAEAIVKPVVQKLKIYPAEFDDAVDSAHREPRRWLPLLFQNLAATGGLHVKHLSLDLNRVRTDSWVLRHDRQMLSTSIGDAIKAADIRGVEKFTIKFWELCFRGGWHLRLWLMSRDCKEAVEHLGLDATPTLIRLWRVENEHYHRVVKIQWERLRTADGETVGVNEEMENGNDNVRPTFMELMGDLNIVSWWNDIKEKLGMGMVCPKTTVRVMDGKEDVPLSQWFR